MRIFTSVLILLVFCGVAYGQQVVNASDISVPYMMKAPAPITVDGNLDEWAWAYPITHSSTSIPDTSRFRVDLAGNLPVDDADMSGTIYMMYDDFALYFAAEVRDDNPGYTSDTQWASDAIEIYMTNWDVGDLIAPIDETGWLDDSLGNYGLQFNCSFNLAKDSTAIFAYGAFNQVIETPNTFMTYQVWPNGDGYTLEGQIDWIDVESPNTGNSLQPQPGARVPVTWSMYDIDPGDEVDGGANFDGWAYTPLGYAGWMGPGPGFQTMDVLDTPRGFEWEDNARFDFVTPFVKQVAPNRPITVDGDLSEWNFAFPTDHWISTMPDSGRFPNELGGNIPTFDEDLRGTLYVQHDAPNGFIYFAASVQDNFPGWLSDVEVWQGDNMELYLADWDIGNLTLPPDRGWVNDSMNGDYSLQFNMGFDAARDSTKVFAFAEFNQRIETPGTFMAYSIWPNNDGYYLEGQIDVFDVESPTTGNILTWNIGDRVPMTWSLYDLDTTTVNQSWKGIAYTPKGFAGWMGINEGFQYSDIKSYNSIEAIDLIRSGLITVNTTTGIGEPAVVSGTISEFTLFQNYPNPFNPSTSIKFNLKNSGVTSLKIYNTLGQLVHTVHDGELLTAGTHTRNVDMSSFASGIYISVLENSGQSSQMKMMLLK